MTWRIASLFCTVTLPAVSPAKTVDPITHIAYRLRELEKVTPSLPHCRLTRLLNFYHVQFVWAHRWVPRHPSVWMHSAPGHCPCSWTVARLHIYTGLHGPHCLPLLPLTVSLLCVLSPRSLTLLVYFTNIYPPRRGLVIGGSCFFFFFGGDGAIVLFINITEKLFYGSSMDRACPPPSARPHTRITFTGTARHTRAVGTHHTRGDAWTPHASTPQRDVVYTTHTHRHAPGALRTLRFKPTPPAACRYTVVVNLPATLRWWSIRVGAVALPYHGLRFVWSGNAPTQPPLLLFLVAAAYNTALYYGWTRTPAVRAWLHPTATPPTR